MKPAARLPLPDAYQRALLGPRQCFADPELQAGTAHTNRQGLPLPWSGQFATVFRVQTTSGLRAVRCFTAPVSDHQERYAALHRHVQGRPLPMLADFEYQPRGIRVGGAWHPIVKMEWVNGEKLDEHVEGLAARRDARRLRELAAQWLQLASGLRRCGMAHGDLQHENILVSQGRLRLVDYDGVFVPALAGRAALEVGHVHYQHPRRTPADFGPQIDNFSALVIYLSLAALAAEPGLWQRFHQDRHLVLRREDFQAPRTSPALAALRQSREPEVSRLASALADACAAPVSAMPALDELCVRQPAVAVAPWPSPRCAAGRTQAAALAWAGLWPQFLGSIAGRFVQAGQGFLLRLWQGLACRSQSEVAPSSLWPALAVAAAAGSLGGWLKHSAAGALVQEHPGVILFNALYWSAPALAYLLTRRSAAAFGAQALLAGLPLLLGSGWDLRSLLAMLASALSVSAVFEQVQDGVVAPEVIFAATTLGAASLGLCLALMWDWRPSAVELSMVFMGALLAAPLAILLARAVGRG